MLGEQVIKPPSSELSFADQGVLYATVACSLEAHVGVKGAPPKALDLSRNPALGVEGIVALAEDWLKEGDGKPTTKKGNVESLNVASCSVGRFLDPNTGAYSLTARAAESLGTHGHRLIALDLSWNDLTAEAMGSLVMGLLGISTPNFEAESFDPAQLVPTRACALSSLELKGNSIGDDGVGWLVRLLGPGSKVQHLGLNQCAVDEAGGAALTAALRHATADARAFRQPHPTWRSLDLRDNDVKAAAGPLAAAAAAHPAGLATFCGMELAEARARLEEALAGRGGGGGGGGEAAIELIAGKDVMCHGVLALLLVARPFVVPAAAETGGQATKEAPPGGIAGAAGAGAAVFATDTANPLAAAAAAGAAGAEAGGIALGGSVAIDLRGSQMCGYYWEAVEAAEALVDLVARANGAHGASDAEGAAGAEAAAAGGRPRAQAPLRLDRVELDQACGLTQRQVTAVAEARGPKGSAGPGPTVVRLDGQVFEPGWGCSVM